jgi:hypothetical protein
MSSYRDFRHVGLHDEHLGSCGSHCLVTENRRDEQKHEEISHAHIAYLQRDAESPFVC